MNIAKHFASHNETERIDFQLFIFLCLIEERGEEAELISGDKEKRYTQEYYEKT